MGASAASLDLSSLCQGEGIMSPNLCIDLTLGDDRYGALTCFSLISPMFLEFTLKTAPFLRDATRRFSTCRCVCADSAEPNHLALQPHAQPRQFDHLRKLSWSFSPHFAQCTNHTKETEKKRILWCNETPKEKPKFESVSLVSLPAQSFPCWFVVPNSPESDG